MCVYIYIYEVMNHPKTIKMIDGVKERDPSRKDETVESIFKKLNQDGSHKWKAHLNALLNEKRMCIAKEEENSSSSANQPKSSTMSAKDNKVKFNVTAYEESTAPRPDYSAPVKNLDLEDEHGYIASFPMPVVMDTSELFLVPKKDWKEVAAIIVMLTKAKDEGKVHFEVTFSIDDAEVDISAVSTWANVKTQPPRTLGSAGG